MPSDPEGKWIDRREARLARREANRAIHDVRKQIDADRRASGKKAVRSLNRYADKQLEQLERLAMRSDIPDPRLLPDDQLVALVQALANVDRYDWQANARPEQIFTHLKFSILLLMCGRGWGKTRAAAEAVREAAEKAPDQRIAVIAKDHRALRDVCFEGVSGLISCIPPSMIKEYRKGLGDVSLTLTNGSTIKGYTAAEPDAIRGQSFHLIWGDEFAAWPKHRAGDMLTQARMCLRESEDSRAILSTTPKRVTHVVEMVELAKDPEESVVVITGDSHENTVLSAEWFRQMEKTYAGTRMGRQELGGELLMDNENALWQANWLEAAHYEEDEDRPSMVGVVVGVDPSGSKDGDATGIVAVGWDKTKALWVLENRTTNGTPAERYTQVCLSAYELNAGEICYESSYGGDNAAFGIQQQWKNLQREGVIPEEYRCPLIVPSKLKGDKAARAMPTVALYEQQFNIPERRRIWHVDANQSNGLAKLEDEMLSWETNSTKSPNAIDAFVHAARRVMQKTGQEVVLSAPSSSSVVENGVIIPRRRQIGGGYNPYA